MRRSKFRRPSKVLIFNGARVLVAIVRSLHCAAELTHENKSAIHNCCTGKSVRSGAYYYRQLHPDILLSGDRLDVYFELNNGSRIAIEVKSVSSSDADVMRGLFQCVKYKSVLDAESKIHGKKSQNLAMLILGGKISLENIKIREVLGVNILEVEAKF